MVGVCPLDNPCGSGLPSMGWCMTILGIVDFHLGTSICPSCFTILKKVGDHPLDVDYCTDYVGLVAEVMWVCCTDYVE